MWPNIPPASAPPRITEGEQAVASAPDEPEKKMSRWDVIVYCTIRKEYFRVGSVEAETIDEAIIVYHKQFRWYLTSNEQRGITPASGIPLDAGSGSSS